MHLIKVESRKIYKCQIKASNKSVVWKLNEWWSVNLQEIAHTFDWSLFMVKDAFAIACKILMNQPLYDCGSLQFSLFLYIAVMFFIRVININYWR